MKKILSALSLAALALSGCASSAPKADAAPAEPAAKAQNVFQIRESLATEDLQASYALGYEIGAAFSALKSSRIDYDAFVQGMMDTLSGRPLLVPSDSAGAIKVALFERIRGDMNKETLEKG
ncbi:MAG: FKBP-type peptidyl-prolyl cis-trans isomerase N-terminal domain-containing protein, partial [Fibrobacterales bacterium]|nr:FKBP-type peptidyl-prolyl cis-trans isomerase N-terminal domain-containing protein [Fibrobacterales bacterium]